MRIKLRDSQGLRSKADIAALDAVIRWKHQDGTEFFFERVGQFDYRELPSGLADRIQAYLQVMKKKPQELTLKEVDDMRKIEEESNAEKSSDGCDDHVRMGQPCTVVPDDASGKKAANENRRTTPATDGQTEIPEATEEPGSNRSRGQSAKDGSSGGEIRDSGDKTGPSDN